jgi:cytosine/uracil/thiamine/allantoin permease
VDLLLSEGSAMLHAIFPGIATLPNIMGKGSALDSGGFIGYVIFWYTLGFLTRAMRNS